MQSLRKLTALTLGTLSITLVTTAAAQAAGLSISTSAGTTSSVPGATTINFTSGAPSSGFAVYTPSAGVVKSGSVSGQWAQPGNPSGPPNPYLSVGPSTTSPVVLKFAAPVNYFGLYWGSIDTYNGISFYKAGSLISSFLGSSVPGTTASGNQTSPADNVYVNFTGAAFDEVRFSSSSNAFESDNHAYAVPVPAAVPGILAASAFFAAKRKKVAQSLSA